MTASPALVLYDDQLAQAFEPFALTRPLGEVRAGAELIRERWERVCGVKAAHFVGASHLATFSEFNAPSAANKKLPAGTLLVNTRFAPDLTSAPASGTAWTHSGLIAAVHIPQELDCAALANGRVTLDSLAAGMNAQPIAGWWLSNTWDLIGHLGAMLMSDINALRAEGEAPPAEMAVLGEHEVLVARGAFIEPFVIADTTAGPVLVREGARVNAFTRLVGPCVIGRHTVIAGGRVATCSIGEYARIHGEISTTIVIGHANKAHDGFVGHSIIGRWANLGAGTITSNLKNSYGTVSLWTPHGVTDTGLQFLGTMLGDHAKTGIGTRLTTGSVIGAGANVFGSKMLPKFVPPFAWGEEPPYGVFELEKFIEVAGRVMSRRDSALTPSMKKVLGNAWSRREQFKP